MNVGGMGSMELLVIMLVGFIVLGPQRMVEAAKLLGKAVREVRRMTADMQNLVLENDEVGTTLSSAARGAGPASTQDDDGTGTSEKPDSDEGPVAYRAAPDTVAKSEPDADARPRQDET